METILENPWVFGAASALGGALLTVLVQRVLHKRGLFTYNVTHNRVGMSADDAVFGQVQVTWNGTQVDHLYLSNLELRNESVRDFQAVTVRVWSTTTSLLTERTDVVGTTHILDWAPEYARKLHVPEGKEATPAQRSIYYGERNYNVPTFNRGQVIRFAFLNAAKTPDSPTIWIDVLHPGVRIKFRVLPQLFMGVPQPSAALVGSLLGLGVVPTIVATIEVPWIAAALSFVYGVVVILPGVALIKFWRWAREIIAG